MASSTLWGILIQGATASTTEIGTNFNVSNNTIYDPNTSGFVTANTGNGLNNPSGINIMLGRNIVVANNTITDDRSTPLQNYGIQIGQTFGPSSNSEPNGVTVVGNRVTGYVTKEIGLVSPTYTSDYQELSKARGYSTATPSASEYDPESLLSVQGIANFTAATSTFYSTGGINLAQGDASP